MTFEIWLTLAFLLVIPFVYIGFFWVGVLKPDAGYGLMVALLFTCAVLALSIEGAVWATCVVMLGGWK